MDWPTLTGIIAAGCTTLAFVPQLFKIERQGSAELSTAMLGMYVGGQLLWLTYGIAIGSLPIIGANLVSIVLVSAVAIRKRRMAAGTGPRRLRIAIDMDDVMADAESERVRRGCPEDAMLDAAFFSDLAVMPGCQEVVRELAARHDVFIVTAAMDVPCSFDAKFRWLQRHFPFIEPSNIVFCGDKSIVDADYLIDDRPRHFGRFKGGALLFSAPHNAGEMRYPRVDSWADVRRILLTPPASPRVRRRRGSESATLPALSRTAAGR
jgi:5'(3')-deoxyribonucleotidase/uncharacterized protein with PQ loop repeat